MDSLGNHLIDIETELNGHLGFNTSQPLGVGEALHQFVFSPTFHPPSTLVLEQSASDATAYFAVLSDSASMKGSDGCWQDIQPIDLNTIAAFAAAAAVAKPWELPHAVTNSRDGILAGYRIQTMERSARFYAFNPTNEEHSGQIAWLKQGLRMAEELFCSTDAAPYLESLGKYFTRA